jgi:hypothetical protein
LTTYWIDQKKIKTKLKDIMMLVVGRDSMSDKLVSLQKEKIVPP